MGKREGERGSERGKDRVGEAERKGGWKKGYLIVKVEEREERGGKGKIAWEEGEGEGGERDGKEPGRKRHREE